MAVFGAPIAHEDDAERAVRAALRITEAIEELNEEANLGLSIRAAVNMGEGLVNLSARPQAGEGMVTGDVVNTASRLQRAAPVKSRDRGRDQLYQEPDCLRGHGVGAAQGQARACSHLAGRISAGPVRRRCYRPLQDPFHRAPPRSNASQDHLPTDCAGVLTSACNVVGEPGVGKSRLLAEFYNYIDEQPTLITWRQGRSLPYGEGITFWALGEIVKAQAGINEFDSPNVASDKLAIAIGHGCG
jgi:Adenylate and Guanylate cyclase catalytic domain